MTVNGKKNVIVDGMNRFAIADKGDLAFKSDRKFHHALGGQTDVPLMLIDAHYPASRPSP